MGIFFGVFEPNDRLASAFSDRSRLVSAFVPVLTIFGLYRCFLRVL